MNLLQRIWLVVTSVYVYPFLRGVSGALSFWQPIKFFRENTVARSAFFKCFQLNGALFLGSMAVMHYIVSPFFRTLVATIVDILGMGVGIGATDIAETPADIESGHGAESTATSESVPVEQDQQTLEAFAELLSSAIFHILWLYPVYCLSFILNAAWYQEVADEAQRHFSPTGAGAQGGLGFLKIVRDEIFRLLLVIGFVIQASVLSAAPAPLGPVMQFACYSWLFSFYCFEYGWAAKGWRLLRRTRHFERNWLFYLGFGVPGAAATTFLPMLVSGGIYALIFPLFIAVGAYCDATIHHHQPRGKRPQNQPGVEGDPDSSMNYILDQLRFQMPIFWFPVQLANRLVLLIQLCCCTKWKVELAHTSDPRQKQKQKQKHKQLHLTKSKNQSQ